MKALTISQPYATLIAHGQKWVENRKWATGYRGKLLIHAGKGTQYLSPDAARQQGHVVGAIVAVCDMTDCLDVVAAKRKLASGQLFDQATLGVLRHGHCEGPFGFVLRSVRRLTPIPCKGAQGFWIPDAIVVAALRAQGVT